VAIVHRQTGAAADALVAQAEMAAAQRVLTGEVAAAQVLRRARYRAFDIELAGRDAIDEASAERLRLETDALRDADRRHARALSEAGLIVAEARDAAGLVLDEAEGRRRAIEAEIAELERLRRELIGQAARFQARLGRLLPDPPPGQDADGAGPAKATLPGNGLAKVKG
jgi:hypothetical protein